MIFRFFAIFILIFFLSLPVYAAEVIHHYHSHINVNKEGGLTVTETIEVTAEGNKIKRGIYRDFPLQRRTFLGGILPVGYRIISVKRDGQTEPYHTERTSNNLRIYIGKSNIFLGKGRRYTYEIIYNVPRQVFFYKDYDEIHWNAIGTGWEFPIEKASTLVTLPEGAHVLDHSAYTGKILSKNRNYRAETSGNSIFMQAQQTLAPHEGMTIAVSFPKGYVEEPEEMAGTAFFWRQHPGLSYTLIGLLVMAAYYYWAWKQVGRDPNGRSLTPFYEPPEGISPAMAACIHTMGDSSAKDNMTAAIISLAAKGYLEIREEPTYYVLTKTKKSQDGAPSLSEDEHIIYSHLSDTHYLKPHSSVLIEAAREHDRKLDKLCRKRYFHINSWWWLAGLIPLIVSITLAGMQPHVSAEDLWLGLLFMAVFGGVALTVMAYAAQGILRGSLRQRLGGLLIFLWASTFLMGGIAGLLLLASSMSWLLSIFAMSMVALFIIMRKLMKAPTRKGRAIMDQLDGLKYYMEAVEEKILKKFDPPEMSRELYEKYLPYAVALGVESQWGDKFALAAAGAATAAAAVSSSGHVDLSPSWYKSTGGSSLSGFSTSGMISSIGGAISAASSSASSSGGGSVGGGGGGGGGGGW